MNWDDLRYVLAVANAGSLARAARTLGVEHTTVGRRVTAAETALGARLFTRTTTGLVPTADADRLLAPMRQVEEAVLAVERNAHPSRGLAGRVRVTAPETFGTSYLAPKLATFGRAHPELVIELVPAGEVLDLGRRQAEIAVRMFRSKRENLTVRRVGTVSYGLYATPEYLARHPLRAREGLHEHALLTSSGANDLENVWIKRLNARAASTFTSPISLALLAAARVSAGIAALPRYLGDSEPALRHVPMPDAPSEPVWLTVHDDLRATPRVRAVLDFLAATIKEDARLLSGG